MARHSNEPTPASAGATPLQAPSPAGDETPRWRSAAAAQDVEDAVVIDRSAPQAEPKAPTAPRPAASNHPLAEPPGSFTRVVFTQPSARHHPHHYHLYVPPGADAATPMPLVPPVTRADFPFREKSSSKTFELLAVALSDTGLSII